MNLKILSVILLTGLLLFGCTQNSPKSTAVPTAMATAQSTAMATAAPTSAATGASTAVPTSAATVQATAAPTQSQAEVQNIALEAKQFQFIPNTITVKKGVPVHITITSDDVTHGFSLPDFNVETQESPGSPGSVDFTPDKTGSFNFACSVVCGGGHGGMTGTLVVTDN